MTTNIKTRHLFTNYAPNLGGITLRYSVNEDYTLLTYKFALCNPKDQYSRKEGVAEADKHGEHSIYYPLGLDDLTEEELVGIILQDIFNKNKKSLPKHAVSRIYRYVWDMATKHIHDYFMVNV
jgi:hypothetical protein